jgi:hypothetical protein
MLETCVLEGIIGGMSMGGKTKKEEEARTDP